MRTLAVLPSRYQASRFPGKPLALIAGRPMIQWVWEAARNAPGVDEVAVATDDARIAEAVAGFGGRVVMTDPALPSGTDRVAAAWRAIGKEFDAILNIQGDEPAMHPATIAGVVALLREDPGLPMATAACPFNSADELFNPNNVKVVVDDRSRALYFSRSPIPYLRNSTLFVPDFRPWLGAEQLAFYLRHLGIYGFRPAALEAFTALPPHPLERMEMLEQLRALAAGMAVGVARTPHLSLGVDVPADVPAVEALLRLHGRK
ncbi:3-deoxy-manno-octulosonate cytidylyltransferase [Mesoterricola sediminis]|uniref:3-deoxy-manno-octulosonate cytidylyltransferase n=1 Tax=Mesoterricola sediminis TaxID=2927980 RepID=A0AA48KFN2_9BACT|nr:3-deoxy-manno-octulosonate cytidylyltransferase [Mesoterricola sediminis]BDU76628.1 3-deoxy-manno-octulosonate cytidylyltransferase [Mesoterricola sediminis]